MMLIRAPPDCGGDIYNNYKETNSIILLAVVDDNYCFTYINIGASGKCSDGGVFQNSYIFREIEHNMLPNDVFFVGDDTYSLKQYLLKPYKHEPLTREQKIISRFEQILSSRFRIFERPVTTNVSVTDKIIRTACALHNWLRKSSTTYLTTDSVYFEDLNSGEKILGSWRTEILYKLLSISRIGRNHSSRFIRELTEKYSLARQNDTLIYVMN